MAEREEHVVLSSRTNTPRAEHGHWVAGGPSPNPLGRPRKGEAYVDKYRMKVLANADEILDAHISALKAGDIRHLVAMMDRLFGVPKQVLQLEGDESPMSALMNVLASRYMQERGIEPAMLADGSGEPSTETVDGEVVSDGSE